MADNNTSVPAFSWKLAAKHAAIPSLLLMALMLVVVVTDPSINSERLGNSVGRFVAMCVIPVSLGTSYLIQTGRRTAGIALAAGAILVTVTVAVAVTGKFSADRNPLTEQERAPLVEDQGDLRHPHLGFVWTNPGRLGFKVSSELAKSSAKRFGERADTKVYAWLKGSVSAPDSTVLLALKITDMDDRASVGQFVEGLKSEIGHRGGTEFQEDKIIDHPGYTEARIRASIDGAVHFAVRVMNPVLGPERKRFLLFVVSMGSKPDDQKNLIDGLRLHRVRPE